MKKQNAFTLIELLVAMTVLLILIAIGSQSYHRLFAHQALVSSAEKLYQFLKLANEESIKENKKVYVHFCQKGASSEWKMALSETSSRDCFIENSCLLNGKQQNTSLTDGKFVFTSPADITFSGNKVSYNTMRFSVNAGSVTLKDSDNNTIKVIQSAMRLRICTPNSARLGYQQC
ncbi:Tfp pilus assembly protein FimT/FimU [Psychromonas sp. KJ10-10]|uniref:Tfp pilus assembly protein FimT/FimU n=1 Tax=Psychromonas sp. KJ10-10 TaxID=3391823 RepID=UPI0039B4859C